jgi:hypothetical protein
VIFPVDFFYTKASFRKGTKLKGNLRVARREARLTELIEKIA